MHFALMFVGSFTDSLPPAARSLAVIVAVYTIMLAVKQNAWVAANINGWKAVVLNAILTGLGALIAIPSDQLYTLNTVVSMIVSILGSSGIHGMSKSIPQSKQ